MYHSRRVKDLKYIKECARNIRQLLGIDDQFAPNLIHILFLLKNLFPKLTVEIIPDSKMRLAEAIADCTSSVLYISDRLRKALDYNEPWARQIVAHEIGHFALHHKGARCYKTSSHYVKGAHRQDEREADDFALAFLAPDHLLAKVKNKSYEIRTAFRLTRKFGDRFENTAREREYGPGHNKRAVPPRVEEYLRAQQEKGYKVLSLPEDNKSSELYRNSIFVAMSFDSDFSRLFSEIIKPAVETAGFVCCRMDESLSIGNVSEELRKRITGCSLLLAEITTRNPNVMHEIGMAESLGKPVIVICRKGQNDAEIPFNIRNFKRIDYIDDVAGGGELLRQLVALLKKL